MVDQVVEDRFTQRAADGCQLAGYRWRNDEPARAVIVLSHGMGEHARRYRTPLTPLIESGVHVYAIDHRGHGATAAGTEGLGDFGPGGFAALASDLADLAKAARAANPGAPIVLLGHSMGSMAAQLFLIQQPSLVDAVALSGSAAVDRLALAMQDPLLLTKLNAAFEPARTPFDWLSRSDAEVDRYIADPWCGFALRPESFASWFSFGADLADGEKLARIPKTLPIYVFSGAMDPLHHALHALSPLIERYRAAGLSVAVSIFPDGRHEILNELNRSEVVSQLADWITRSVLARRAVV